MSDTRNPGRLITISNVDTFILMIYKRLEFDYNEGYRIKIKLICRLKDRDQALISISAIQEFLAQDALLPVKFWSKFVRLLLKVLALIKRFDKKIKIWSDQSLKQFKPGPCQSCFMFCSVLFSVSCFQNHSNGTERRRGGGNSIFTHY